MSQQKVVTLIAIALLAGSAGRAQQPAAAKPLGWQDVSSWRSIPPSGFTLSPDGRWVAYALHPVEGDGVIVIRKVGDTVRRSFPIGASPAFSAAFSEDGRWIAYKEFPREAERRASTRTPAGKPLQERLHLLSLSDWKRTTYDKAGAYAFNGRASTHLAVSVPRERGQTGGGDLHLTELATGATFTLGNVGEYAFNKAGDRMAYTVDAAGQAGNGAYLMQVSDKRTTVVDNARAAYRSLGWNEDGTAFALLKMVKDEAWKNERGSVIGVKDLAAGPAVTVYDPAKDSSGFPKGMTVSPNRNPAWTDDLDRIVFGIHRLEPVKKAADAPAAPVTDAATEAGRLAKLRADTAIRSIEDLQKAIARLSKPAAGPEAARDTLRPDMTIWHWQDRRLQSRQQVQEAMDRNRSLLALVDVATGRCLQLQDSTLTAVTPLPKQHFALAQDNRSHELQENLDGQSYTDYHLVDMRTGSRSLLFPRFHDPGYTAAPKASWDGRRILYGLDGHYRVRDLVTGADISLTERIPTSFVNTEDDHNVRKPLTGFLGWSRDDRHVLLRDLWDIWLIPTDGRSPAVNLTRNGRTEGIRYQSVVFLDPEEKGFDVRKPLYIRIYGERTKRSGYARIEADAKGLKPGALALVWEDANVYGLRKAKNAEVYLFMREDANRPTEYYAGDATLKNATQVSENAPDAPRYALAAGSRLVDYVSDKGDTLQGALLLPAGHEPGKRYPTVVYYYEKLSQTLHNWSNPDFGRTGWNPTMYTSNGYAVFIPDIVYRLDDPGMSAVWCVLPGVKAAIATGVVDPDRIGIHGHSWGGYQTCFLITQTGMFKAAAAGAPLTNMVSMYDLVYWNSGGGNMSIFEASQGRFRGAPWENWEAYLRNSPVYHVKNVTTPLLMLHNDKDGAVDFTQGVEFYNALRRLQKPVVMVQYKGENHGLVKMENRKDYSVRMMEFFDHHLKGRPAPGWLKDGVERLKLEEHLRQRVF